MKCKKQGLTKSGLSNRGPSTGHECRLEIGDEPAQVSRWCCFVAMLLLNIFLYSGYVTHWKSRCFVVYFSS